MNKKYNYHGKKIDDIFDYDIGKVFSKQGDEYGELFSQNIVTFNKYKSKQIESAHTINHNPDIYDDLLYENYSSSEDITEDYWTLYGP